MSKVIYVRVPDDDHDYVARRAENEGRSITEVVRRLIETARHNALDNSQIITDNRE
jgi:predicted HicB family RNase H-like nuclease